MCVLLVEEDFTCLVRIIHLISLVLTTGRVGKRGHRLLESLHASRLQSGGRLLVLLGGLVSQLFGQGNTGILTLEQVPLDKTCLLLCLVSMIGSRPWGGG